MFKKLKSLFITSVSILTLMVPAVAMPAVAYAEADIQGGLNCGSDLELSSTGCSTPANTEDDLNDIIALVINIFSVVVGIIAVIMIIVGGVKYVLSGGASDQVSSAKNTILFAVVGLVIVALAQIIVHYVLNRVDTVTG